MSNLEQKHVVDSPKTDENNHSINDYPDEHHVETIYSTLTLVGILPNGEGASYLDSHGGNWHFKLNHDTDGNEDLTYIGRHSHTDNKPMMAYAMWVANNIGEWRALSDKASQAFEPVTETVDVTVSEIDLQTKKFTKYTQADGQREWTWEMDVEDARSFAHSILDAIESQEDT